MEHTHKLKLIAKGAFLVIIGMFISKLFTYLYRMIIARYLGPEAYGLLSLAFSILSFAILISLMGIDSGVIRYVAYFKGKKDNAKIKGIIIQSLKIVAIVSTISSIVLFLIADLLAAKVFHIQKLGIIIRIISITIPFGALSFLFFSIFRAFQKIEYEVYSKHITEPVLKFIITLAIILLGYNVIGASIVYLVAVISSFMLALYFLEKKVFAVFKTNVKTINSTKELVSYSLPLLFTGFFFSVLQWTDTLMLGNLRSVEEVGIYNAALPISDLMFIGSLALVAIFMPIITELFAKRQKRSVERVFSITTKWIVYYSLPMFVILATFSKEILSILFGNEYISAYISLSILSFGAIFFSISLSYNDYLKMLKKTKYILANSALAAIANIILNWILIPRYGINGAATATALSWIIFFLLTLAKVKAVSKIKIFNVYYIKATISCVLSSVVLYAVINLTNEYITNLLIKGISIIIFLITYILFLVYLRGIEKEDMELIHAIRRKLRL